MDMDAHDTYSVADEKELDESIDELTPEQRYEVCVALVDALARMLLVRILAESLPLIPLPRNECFAKAFIKLLTKRSLQSLRRAIQKGKRECKKLFLTDKTSKRDTQPRTRRRRSHQEP
jgi:hypothetical protein